MSGPAVFEVYLRADEGLDVTAKDLAVDKDDRRVEKDVRVLI